MMTYLRTALGALVFLAIACHSKPPAKLIRTVAYKLASTELERINSRIEAAYSKGRVDSLLDLYDTACTYLPEYKATIYEKQDLRKFFTNWFKTDTIASYSKKIYSVEDIDGYVLEIGTFVLTSSKNGVPAPAYAGKYMIMWKRYSSTSLKILSEAFGSDKHVSPQDIPYAGVEVPDRRPLDSDDVSQALQPAIEAFDSGVVKAVMTGDGAARAAEFTADGIYMPHFDPMQIGMEMLKPYMLKTYRPNNAFKYVKDTFREIFTTPAYVFLVGHFKVGFANGSTTGSFEGNMVNLMKWNTAGQLLMYRQLAHN